MKFEIELPDEYSNVIINTAIKLNMAPEKLIEQLITNIFVFPTQVAMTLCSDTNIKTDTNHEIKKPNYYVVMMGRYKVIITEQDIDKLKQYLQERDVHKLAAHITTIISRLNPNYSIHTLVNYQSVITITLKTYFTNGIVNEDEILKQKPFLDKYVYIIKFVKDLINILNEKGSSPQTF